jgi:hypothetical protein
MGIIPITHRALKTQCPVKRKEQQWSVIDMRDDVYSTVQKTGAPEPEAPSAPGSLRGPQTPQADKNEHKQRGRVQEVMGGDPKRMLKIEIIKHLAEGFPTTPSKEEPIVNGSAQRQAVQRNIRSHGAKQECPRDHGGILEPLPQGCGHEPV